MNHLQPYLPDANLDATRKRSTKRFNDIVINRARHLADLQFLASPVTGAGISLDRFEQLFLLARQNKDADPISFVWRVLDAGGQRLVKDGITLQTEEENRQNLAERLATFEQRLPVLHALGIA